MGRDCDIPGSGTRKRLWVQAQNAQKEKEEARMDGGYRRKERRKKEREKRGIMHKIHFVKFIQVRVRPRYDAGGQVEEGGWARHQSLNLKGLRRQACYQ